MNTWSKREVKELLLRYKNMSHDDVFESGWNQPVLSEVEELLKKDVQTLYWSLNTHAYMFQDLSNGMSSEYVKSYVTTTGLVAYIESCGKILDSLNSTDKLEDVKVPLGHPAYYLLERCGRDHRVYTFLNWLKRIPIKSFNFESLMCDNFINSQFRANQISTESASYQLIVEPLAHIIKCLLHGVKVDDDQFVLAPGQYLENIGKPYSYYQKWLQLSAYRDELPKSWQQYFKAVPHAKIPDCNMLRIVPKNYKKGRTICIESIYTSTMAYRLSEPMTKRLNRKGVRELGYASCYIAGKKLYFPIGGCYYNYQQSNHVRAMLGSLSGDVATVDVTAASDSVYTKVCRDILPKLIFDYGYLYRSQYTCVPTKKGTTIECNTYMTMGHPMTYPVESVVFFACLVLATCWTLGVNPMRFKVTRHLLDVDWSNPYFAILNAIGDDMTIHSDCIPALFFILDTLGFIVNKDKTYYGDVKYRESCGKEYFNGFDVTGYYYPRGTSTNEYAELIGLQHKLVEYPLASAFIIDEIRKVFPKVTCSPIGSEYSDIWLPGTDTPKTIGKPRKFMRSTGNFTVHLSDLAAYGKYARLEVLPTCNIAFHDIHGRVIDNVDAIGSITLTYGFNVIGGYGANLGMLTYHNVSYDREVALTILRKLQTQDLWRHDFLINRVPSNDWLSWNFPWHPNTELFKEEEVLESPKQGVSEVHTSVISKHPRRTAGEILEAQECAYMFALARTRSQETNREWYDKDAIVDYSDLINSVLGGTKTHVQNRTFPV